MIRHRRLTALLAAAGLVLTAVPGGVAATRPNPQAITVPALRVTRWVTGLTNPWDLTFLPGGYLLVTERGGAIKLRLPSGAVRTIVHDRRDLWVSGETGMMAIEADPAFAANRRVYTCQGSTDLNNTVQVIAWTMNTALTTMTRVNDPLVGYSDGSSGRHGGCQLRFGATGALYIGTGDAAVGTNPQNLRKLAGKVLRVNRFTGAGLAGNITNGDLRIYTYGHRNVQGLALSPRNAMFSVEHGPDRDDEINVLVGRGNYGWDPIPGYNESVPMTDLTKFPAARWPVWRTGFPTVAISGASFIKSTAWGAYSNGLATAALKGQQLRIFTFNGTRVVNGFTPVELRGTYGRLRGVEFGPDGALYVTTSNSGGDFVLRIVPA